MVEFDVKCRQCAKPITLRVRDQEAQEVFVRDGALCEDCYRASFRRTPQRRRSWQGVTYGHYVHGES